MPLVRGLLLAHLCASALLLLVLWAVVLAQHLAARRRAGRVDGGRVLAPRGAAAGAVRVEEGSAEATPVPAAGRVPDGRGTERLTSPSP